MDHELSDHEKNLSSMRVFLLMFLLMKKLQSSMVNF